jgi:MFS family permease
VTAPRFNAPYKAYVLITLTLVYTLSMSDQGIIALLLQPIKEDFRLSDSELGFLTGAAFAVLYASLGIPIGRLADYGHRPLITSVSVAIWGTAVSLSPFVTDFSQLVLMRIVASVGAAGCMPPTYSLLADYFPRPAERNSAMTIYTLANSLSLFVGFFFGGQVAASYGWRISFVAVGIPAILMALLLKLTVREPRVSAIPPGWSLRDLRKSVRPLWHHRSIRHLALGMIVLYTMGFGLAPWYAAFMIRSHGMTTQELGVWLGAVLGVGGIVGTLFGGHAIEWWFRNDERGQIRFVAVSIATLVPCLGLFLLLPEKWESLTWFVVFTTLINLFFGPTFTILQRLVAEETRATTLAVVMFGCNLVGMGVGPQLVGTLSDLLAPASGQDSLRYSMLVVSLMAFWAAYHFWKVGVSVVRDLANVEGPMGTPGPGVSP